MLLIADVCVGATHADSQVSNSQANSQSCCRLASTAHRRLGGQGAVVFGHLAYDSSRELAIKFFFDKGAFDREAETACLPVRTANGRKEAILWTALPHRNLNPATLTASTLDQRPR